MESQPNSNHPSFIFNGLRSIYASFKVFSFLGARDGQMLLRSLNRYGFQANTRILPEIGEGYADKVIYSDIFHKK
jgi:hypothetical protein